LRHLIILLCGITVGGSAVYYSARTQPGPATVDAAEVTPTATSVDDGRRNAIVLTVQRVSPAVVGVHTTLLKEVPVNVRDPFMRFFYTPGMYYQQQAVPSIGSGFVIREDGYILTNYHVVKDARSIAVTFTDGRRFEIEDMEKDVIYDRQNDLAVLRIDADGLPVAELGNSDDAIIGEWAIAIGNPFGLELEDLQPTVTVGVISAVHRNFQPDEDGRIYEDMIQTDAAINPGNSGGPLVNSLGEVIGVNTFIFSHSGGSLGIGFAIPSSRAAEIANRLIEEGPVTSVWHGLQLHTVNRRLAWTLGLATERGALIVRIDGGSPGEHAGLEPADVIVGIDGNRVVAGRDVMGRFRGGRPGETHTIQIVRGSRTFEATLELAAALGQ